jgi:hypothetical protein
MEFPDSHKTPLEPGQIPFSVGHFLHRNTPLPVSIDKSNYTPPQGKYVTRKCLKQDGEAVSEKRFSSTGVAEKARKYLFIYAV